MNHVCGKHNEEQKIPMPLCVMFANMNQQALARCSENEASYDQDRHGRHNNGDVLDCFAVVGQYDHDIMAHAKAIADATRLSGEISLKMGMAMQPTAANSSKMKTAEA